MIMAEFLGFKFQELLDSYGIAGQPNTVKNTGSKWIN